MYAAISLHFWHVVYVVPFKLCDLWRTFFFVWSLMCWTSKCFRTMFMFEWTRTDVMKKGVGYHLIDSISTIFVHSNKWLWALKWIWCQLNDVVCGNWCREAHWVCMYVLWSISHLKSSSVTWTFQNIIQNQDWRYYSS